MVALVLLLPATASAHTELLRSDPPDGAVLDRSPERVRLTFNEQIEPEFFSLAVYGQNRVRVDRQDARVPANDVAGLEASLPPLQPGTYTVVWRVLSIDSHVVRGVFAFSVGAAAQGAQPLLDLPTSATPFALGASVRWWTFLLMFVLVGGLGFLPLVLQPALLAAGIADPTPARRAARQYLWIAWPALVLLLLLSLAALLLQAAEVTGVPLSEVLRGRAITRLLTGTKYGALWLTRMGLLLGILGVLTMMSAAAQPRNWARWLGVGLGAGVLLTISATGHASAVPRAAALAVAADWLHLLAGAIWIGGLVQLILAVFPVLKLLDSTQRRQVLARLFRRFSTLAGASVAALLITGTYAGVIHVPSWQALLDTSYGAALSSKLIVFVPLLALGAINLLVLHPYFVRAAQTTGKAANDAGRIRWFRLLVLGEVGLAVLVLAATGILTGLPPATTEAATGSPYSATQPVGDLRATLSITPNQAGSNQVELALVDSAGQPAAVDQVMLAIKHRQMDMGERKVQMQATGAGRFQASGNFLSMAGPWQADVRVRRGNQPEQTGTFQLEVGRAPGNGSALSPLRIIWNALTPGAIIGAVLVGLAALIFVQRTRFPTPRSRRQAAVIGFVVLVAGSGGIGAEMSRAYRVSRPPQVPATPASIARGQELYAKNCAQCHGATGAGDGPAAITMNPRPANLQYHMAQGHTNADLSEWIANGISGTAMPAFKGTLSEEEIWHVINKIRTFAPQQGAQR